MVGSVSGPTIGLKGPPFSEISILGDVIPNCCCIPRTLYVGMKERNIEEPLVPRSELAFELQQAVEMRCSVLVLLCSNADVDRRNGELFLPERIEGLFLCDCAPRIGEEDVLRV